MTSLNPLVACIALIIFVASISLQSCSENHSEEIAIPDTFTNLCSSCHGNDLKGDIAQSLLDGSWQFGARNGDLFRSIKFGHPQFGMPSWGSVLDDEQINEMVDFLVDAEERLGITKAPIPTEVETQDYQLTIETFVDSLDTPWGITFLDQHTALVTERPGRLRIVKDGKLLTEPVAGTPDVVAMGQGGLLDVVPDPDFTNNGWVYLSFSHGLTIENGKDTLVSMTSIIRGKIVDNLWLDQQVIYEADHQHYLPTRHHYGGRIAFDQEGFLYFSIGDRACQNLPRTWENPMERYIEYIQMGKYQIQILL